MDFTTPELRCLGKAQKLAHLFGRGIVTPDEIAGPLIYDLARSGTDRVIAPCLAALPDAARPAIESRADLIESSGYRHKFVLFIGPGPSEEAWASVLARCRPVVEGIRAFYRELDARPGLRESLALPEVDLFWVGLKEIGPAEGEICRSEGCDHPRVRVSVFCDRHHYEQIAKKPAPAY